MSEEETQMKRVYRVTLWASVSLDDGIPQYSAEGLIEHLTAALRRAEPNCDLQVEDFEDIEDADLDLSAIEAALRKVSDGALANDQAIIGLISTITNRLLELEGRIAILESTLGDMEEEH